MIKTVNLQCIYKVPVEYPWIARNQNGILNGFLNPPIRDFKTGEWQDSVTGDYGFFIPYDRWDISVRKMEELTDCVERLKRMHREYQNPHRDPGASRIDVSKFKKRKVQK